MKKKKGGRSAYKGTKIANTLGQARNLAALKFMAVEQYWIGLVRSVYQLQPKAASC